MKKVVFDSSIKWFSHSGIVVLVSENENGNRVVTFCCNDLFHLKNRLQHRVYHGCDVQTRFYNHHYGLNNGDNLCVYLHLDGRDNRIVDVSMTGGFYGLGYFELVDAFAILKKENGYSRATFSFIINSTYFQLFNSITNF